MMPFYTDDQVEQVAINLFHGWGYDFYKLENQLRADDLMLRAKLCGLLSQAALSVQQAESAYRRARLPTLTRQNPSPDPQALAGARALEALSREIGALEGEIRALPAPGNDRMTQRIRNEADTLARLLAADRTLAGRAELLRGFVSGQSGEALLAAADDIGGRIAFVRQALAHRRGLLDV